MRSRLATFVIGALAAAPALAAAQSGASGDRTRVTSQVVVEQQRERARTRVVQVDGDRRHQERETVSRTVRIGDSGEVIVSNLSGDITVTRGSGNDLQIEAVKVARGRDAEDARGVLKLLRIDIIERGSRVEIKAVYPSQQDLHGQQRRQYSASVHYTITAPAGTRVSARTLSGDVKVTDIRGDISAESTSGDVSISGAERIIRAETKSGDVEILNSSSEVAFEAHTMSGNVTLRQIKAPRLEAASISGDVLISEVNSSRIEAQSISGNIEFASPFVKGGRYDFQSHSGTVRIVVLGGSGFEIEATTFSGSIQADPSLNLKNDEDEPGRRRQRSLRAVHGDGSALIDATTFSGRVIVTKK